MKDQQLADISVKITQVIKTHDKLTPQEIMIALLEMVPELKNSMNDAIDLFTRLAEQLNILYSDVYDIIGQITYKIRTSVSALFKGNFLHSIAVGLYYVGKIILGFLPPAVSEIGAIVLGAYKELVL